MNENIDEMEDLDSDEMSTIPNDFGRELPPTLTRNLSWKEGLVEWRIRLSIFELTKTSQWEERRFPWKPFFLGGHTRVKLVEGSHSHDWYIDLVDYWHHASCSTINIVETKCKYGGYRQWFECPGCKKRAGMLYKKGYEFRCRKCLKLKYSTQKMNYRTLAPTLHKWKKLENMEEDVLKMRQTYAGNTVKKVERYERMRMQVDGLFGVWLERQEPDDEDHSEDNDSRQNRD